MPHQAPWATGELATVLGLDRQGWITVIAGLLLALITLFTSYSHVTLPGVGTIAINQQGGVPLIAASLAALALEAQLASRGRLRDQRDRASERDRAAAERFRADQE